MIGFFVGFATGFVMGVSLTVLVLMPEFEAKFGGRDA